MDGIRNYTRTEEQFFEKIQQRLLKAYLDNRNFDSAAQIISEQFKCACAIYDANGSQIGLSTRRFRAGGPKDAEHRQVVSIQTGERLYGHLHLEHSDAVNLTMIDRYLIFPLLLWFDREQVVHASRQAEKDDFVWKLAKGSPDDQKELIRAGQLLGFNLTLSYACVVGSIRTDPPNDDYTDTWIASNIFSVKEHILALAAALRRNIMLTYQQDLLILFVDSPSEGGELHVNQFLDKVEEKFSVVFPHLFFSWGISEAKSDPVDHHESYLRAKLAQELCPDAPGKHMRYSYKSTTVLSILTLLSDTPKIHQELMSIIEPILEYDRENQASLLYTLQMYLKMKNISATSRLLHLHRQSLIYRLNKIEALTCMPLKDADNCFLLEVAVRLLNQQ